MVAITGPRWHRRTPLLLDACSGISNWFNRYGRQRTIGASRAEWTDAIQMNFGWANPAALGGRKIQLSRYEVHSYGPSGGLPRRSGIQKEPRPPKRGEISEAGTRSNLATAIGTAERGRIEPEAVRPRQPSHSNLYKPSGQRVLDFFISNWGPIELEGRSCLWTFDRPPGRRL